MSTLRSKSLFLALALLVAGVMVLGGCMPASPASIVAAAASVPSAGSGAQGITTVGPAAPAQQPAQPAIDTARTITVVGQGEVKVKPTVATSNIGIEVTAATVADAMKDARAQMDSVLKALKDAGIADKDIQTSNFSINFERQGPTPLPAKGVGTAEGSTTGVYHVNNMVNVTIRDLDKVGAVLDAATNAGANNVWGISFGIEDTKALEADARQKAVDDAKARAQSLAQLNGVTLGRVVAVSEVIGQTGPRPMMDKAMGMGGGGTPVEPGEVSVSTQIQVVYSIQ